MGADPRLVTIVLEVADLDRSVALYAGVLGLDLHVDDHVGAGHGADDRWIGGRHAATSWTDGAFLHFALYEAKDAPTARAQLAFRVEDLSAAHAAMTAAGVPVLHPPRAEPWGTSARYRDPDGNTIELTQPA